MAVVNKVYASIESIDPQLEGEVTDTLRQVHGIHGLRLMRDVVDLDLGSVNPDLIVTDSGDDGKVSIIYTTSEGELVADNVEKGDRSIQEAMSRFALNTLRIPVEEQTSRSDLPALTNYMGERPNIGADPTPWIASNPFIAKLLARHPQYQGVLNYLCNERGLFLKVGNYPDQRSHWNSTTNGGLPVFKKKDPIHEGTFMWHDCLHFVPVDPTPGSEEIDEQHQAAYVAHRLLSEASTLVLADMAAVDHAGLQEDGYDVTKRRIFPIYDSIRNAQGGPPDIRQLLTANAYFCFTGNPEGFRNLGASDEVVETFRGKYGAIFRNDFMWNLGNVRAMAEERQENPLIMDYHRWLEANTSAPTMRSFDQKGIITPDTPGLNMDRMLDDFYSQFGEAFNYDQPLDEEKRAKLAAQKYLAGQRVVFARYGQQVDSKRFTPSFDDSFAGLADARDPKVLASLVQTANGSIDSYLTSLYREGVILPHEVEVNRFTAPLYPIKFVNYEKDRDPSKSFEDELNEFLMLSVPQLTGLFKFYSRHDILESIYNTNKASQLRAQDAEMALLSEMRSLR